MSGSTRMIGLIIWHPHNCQCFFFSPRNKLSSVSIGNGCEHGEYENGSLPSGSFSVSSVKICLIYYSVPSFITIHFYFLITYGECQERKYYNFKSEKIVLFTNVHVLYILELKNSSKKFSSPKIHKKCY